MIQSYIEQGTKKVRHIVELAVGEMAALKQNTLNPDFLLLALLSQPDSGAMQIIHQLSPKPVDVATQLKGLVYQHYKMAASEQGEQVLASKELGQVFKVAYDLSRDLGDTYISTGVLFIALFDTGAGHTADFLKQAGLNKNEALKALKELRNGSVIATDDAETEADLYSGSDKTGQRWRA